MKLNWSGVTPYDEDAQLKEAIEFVEKISSLNRSKAVDLVKVFMQPERNLQFGYGVTLINALITEDYN